MKTIRFYTCLVMTAFCLTAIGQDLEAQKKEINEIKKNPGKYLYVEIVDSLEEQALAKAQHALQDDIDDYVKENKNLKNASSIIARNIKTKSITMPRGSNRYRAFAYVRKDDIIPADNAVVRENTAKPAVDSQQADSKVEFIRSDRYNETLQKLAALKKVKDITPTLNQLKKDGRIADYKKIKELDGDVNQYVLLLCTREGNVQAVLSEGPQRVNIATGQPDDTANYKGVATLCVKVND